MKAVYRLGECHYCQGLFPEDKLTECGICGKLTCEVCFATAGVCNNCVEKMTPEEVMRSGARVKLKKEQTAILKMLKSVHPGKMELSELKKKLELPEREFEEAALFLEGEGFIYREFVVSGFRQDTSRRIRSEGSEMVNITEGGIYVLEKGRRPIRESCYRHQGIESRYTCERCGRPICLGCRIGFSGHSFCDECIGPAMQSGQVTASPEEMEKWSRLTKEFKTATQGAQIGPSPEELEKWKKAAEDLKKIADKYKKKMKDTDA